MTDILQIALSYGFAGCALIALIAFQAARLAGMVLDLARLAMCYVVPVWRPWFLAKVAAFALALWAMSEPLSFLIEQLETRYIHPVYAGQSPTDQHALAIYEARIREHCDEYEARVVIERTAQIADSINSTPLAIYETALLECGLNPFRVRDDKVAAGWIQFTRAGLSGLGVTLEQVIQACEKRDIVAIMDLTDRYLVRKWEKAGRPDMRNTIDLYLAVFAPAFIGADEKQVVYAGFENRAYTLNSGLDGWYCEPSGKIVRGAKDGKITALEIFYCLERKKGLLLKQ